VTRVEGIFALITFFAIGFMIALAL